MQLSADDKYILTISGESGNRTTPDNMVKLWECNTGKLLYTFRETLLTTALLSPDMRYVITLGYRENNCKIWSTSTGDLLTTLNTEKNTISSVDISPDGRYIATTCSDSVTRIWNTTKFQLIKELPSPGSEASKIVFSPGGTYLGAVYWWEKDHSINKMIVWKTNDFSKLYEREYPLEEHEGGMRGICFSPNEKLFCTYGFSAKTILRDVQTGIQRQQDINYNNDKASFSYDNRYLLLSNESAVSIWDIQANKMIREVDPEMTGIADALFGNRDHNYFILSQDLRLMTGNTERSDLLHSKLSNSEFLSGYALQVTKDGKRCIVSNGDSLLFSEPFTGKKIHSFQALAPNPEKVIVSPSGNQLLAWYKPGILKSSVIGKGYSSRIIDTGFTDIPRDAWFHPSGEYFITSFWKNSMRAWNAKTLARVSKQGFNNLYNDSLSQEEKILFSRSGRYFLKRNNYYGDTLAIYDFEKGLLNKLSNSQKLDIRDFNDAVFSNGEQQLVLLTSSYNPLVWTVPGGQLSGALLGHGGSPQQALYTRDDKFIITTSDDGAVRVYKNDTSFQLLHTLREWKWKFAPTVWLDEEQNQLVALIEEETFTWQIPSFSLLQKKSTPYRVLGISGDKKYLIGVDAIQKIVLLNSRDSSFLETLDGEELMNPTSGKYLIIRNGGILDYYTRDSFTKTFSSLFVDQSDFIFLPQGYFMGSKDASRMLHYVKGLNTIGFEQLDARYNRPDKVLEALGNTDTALIKSYRKAWEKRIKKLGIDTTTFRDGYSVPEADFSNRNAIQYEQKTGTLKLLIKGSDSSYKLDRFNVWVNEIPVFGQRGISIRSRNKNDLDTAVIIRLSQGENRVETSVTNVNGTESFRMPLTVNYLPAVKEKESIRFIGIGIDQFADNKYNLQYSAKDIRDLSKKLKEKYGSDVTIDTLFNENVTVNSVKALKQKLLQTTENDKVIIAYSGHGMLSKDYDYYLSTYPVNFDKPEENGLPYDELEALLDSIPARKKLMLIDACHSGEVDKEDLITLNASSNSLIKGLKPVAYKKEGHLGLKNSFELMQSLFVNVGKSTGATIISAAAGTQFALERNDLKNGVFTYSILEAMNKYPSLKISELKKIVGERVQQLTKGLQKPTSRNETIAVDWNVW